MINVLGSVPNNICVAVSGGADSMAALHFLRNGGKRNVLALHFNHGTDHSSDAENLVVNYCNENNIPLVIGDLDKELPKGVSKENFWRENRYSFFNRESGDRPVITCHHLDDVVETWVFTSLHGNPMLIPHKRDNYIRPFLTTGKQDLLNWCHRKHVPYVTDPSNQDTSYIRNYIRHILLPNALYVNPGLSKVVKKKIEKEYNNTDH